MSAPIDQQPYRQIIASMGVSKERLERAERANPQADWRRPVLALDAVFALGGGSAQSWFWRQRTLRLQGLTPLEVLVLPGGLERVAEAATTIARNRP